MKQDQSQPGTTEDDDDVILPHDVERRWVDILGNFGGGGDHIRALMVAELWHALLTGQPEAAALIVRVKPYQLTTNVRTRLAKEIAPWLFETEKANG